MARGRGRGYHALAGVSHPAGVVQEAAVLQLLAEPLQGVERLVELHRHRHLGQVFAYIVAEDVPKAHVHPGPAGGWQAAAARGRYSSPRNTRPWANADTSVSGTPAIQTRQAHCTGLPPNLLRHPSVAHYGS